MSNSTTDTRIIHGVTTGLTLPVVGRAGGTSPGGRVLYQGETVELTAAQVEETKDRDGISWLDMTNEEQISRFGEIKFATGPAPAGLKLAGDDSSYRIRQRQQELSHMEQISDPGERFAERQRIRAEFSDVAPGGTQTIAKTGPRTGF